MNPWRRAAIWTTAAAVVFVVPDLSAGAQEPSPNEDQTSVEGDPVIPAPGPGEIVHSWALSPAGSDDPTQAGNRPNLSYNADPGAVINDAVTLYNYGNEQLSFDVYATDAFNNPAGQVALLSRDEQPTAVGTWVALSEDVVTVPPGLQATIPFVLRIPEGTAPGDYTGAILAANGAVGTGPDGDTITLDRRTGTSLVVRVNGPLAPELAVTDITTDYDTSINPLGGSAVVTYTIENRGNVRLAGTSTVTLSGPFGLGSQKLEPFEFPVLLPGEEISVSTAATDVPALGVLITEVELEPVGGGSQLESISRSAVSLALPISVLLVALALLFGVLAARAIRRHRRLDAESTALREPDREPQMT